MRSSGLPQVPPASALKRDVIFLRRGSASNMASRLEINFIRLLSRCESIASEKRGETEWRLEKVRPRPRSSGRFPRSSLANFKGTLVCGSGSPRPHWCSASSASIFFSVLFIPSHRFFSQFVAALEEMLAALRKSHR